MRVRVFCLAFICLLFMTSWAFAAVEKAAVKSIEVHEENGESLVRVAVELWSQEGGEAYLELSTDYDGKTYVTTPLRMSCSFPYQVFTFLLYRKDFRRLNLAENLNEELPELVAEKSIVAYVYGQKIITPTGQTEDVKREITQRGYALREILAKGTQVVKGKKK